MKFLRKEPALTAALASVLGAGLAVFIDNPALVAALVGVAVAFIGVRSVVVPVVEVIPKITEAATVAATEVVKSLDETVVGTVGEVLPAAQEIVTSTVKEVVGLLKGETK